MPPYRKVHVETRTRALVLVEEGYSYRAVGTRLGISHKTVFRIVHKHRQTGSVGDKPRSGRPKSTTPRQDRILIRKSLGNRRLTAPELRAQMEVQHGVRLASRTVRQRLFKAGLRGCVAAKKPLLRDATVRKRLAFAREHRNWTVAQWESVLWSDESAFQLFCGAKRAHVRRRVGERYSPQCIVPTVKHGGGSLMIWGCMSGLGVGQVYRCEGTMRQDQYIRVLRNHMLPSATALYGQGQAFVFQQDNAPCHKARRVSDFLQRSGVVVMDWPAQSPDLNPIEHLWEVLFRKVENKKPSNLNALWQLLQEAWVDIPAATIQKLVHSMPARCAAVVKAKGRHTRY